MKSDLIRSDPKVMMGKPVIAGTRITVELIFEKLAAAETAAQTLEAHPRLTEEADRAAQAFAAEVLRADVVYPIGESARSISRPMEMWICRFFSLYGNTKGQYAHRIVLGPAELDIAA